MPNSFFKFKKFTIHQDKCAMKVGTDGCLIGAWTNLDNAKRVLDVGCGTGIIALMTAQRSDAHITAIEIDIEATQQAADNIALSPWKDRIEVINCDYLLFSHREQFDVIVSNPPFFINSLSSPDAKRNKARHHTTLGAKEFLEKSYNLLNDNGHLSIILPCNVYQQWKKDICDNGFAESKLTHIKSLPHLQPKRVLIELRKKRERKPIEETLILEKERGVYSENAKELLQNFYLKI